jgi:hypothetical protein
MHSSTSNSDLVVSRRWGPAWVIGVMLAGALVGYVEWHWRVRGYAPNIRDSAQLWSIERDRVDHSKKTPFVMLGASRIEFAVDMTTLKQLLPKYEPIMLAQNAHYPLAVLRDLADDENFHGVVLCDIEPRGLYKMYTDLQQPLVDYYHRQWSPAWRVHRLLLNEWQRIAVVANPDLGPVAIVKRKLAHEWPQPPDYMRFYTDRSGDLDYQKTDVDAARRHFAQLIANRNGDLGADVAPEQWLADLSDVIEWTRRIDARGGRVIFYQSPTSGQVRDVERVMHPTHLYWDRVAAAVPASLDGLSDPALSAFVEPDYSHLDFREKPAYTRTLVDALVQRGYVEK